MDLLVSRMRRDRSPIIRAKGLMLADPFNEDWYIAHALMLEDWQISRFFRTGNGARLIYNKLVGGGDEETKSA